MNRKDFQPLRLCVNWHSVMTPDKKVRSHEKKQSNGHNSRETETRQSKHKCEGGSPASGNQRQFCFSNNMYGRLAKYKAIQVTLLASSKLWMLRERLMNAEAQG